MSRPDSTIAAMLLAIEHSTCYRYRRPVRFGPHRLLIRAIESHDVQIRASGLSISPAYRVRWLHDVFGNSLAIADFSEPASRLEIHSTLTVEQFNTNPFDFVLDPGALTLPFEYDPSERADVAPYREVACPADREAVAVWTRPFLDGRGSADTLEFFTALNQSVPHGFQYARREAPGVQTPATTLSKRRGSCRDFAQLLIEAARHMGVAARFVSGYLCRARGEETGGVGSDATHAWAEIYLPGAGWKGFDPTTGMLAADLHVRTAVTRDPAQAIPVAGSFVGANTDFLRMDVTVNARAVTAGVD
jgi:transglutaminase-like putative cysteine protease